MASWLHCWTSSKSLSASLLFTSLIAAASSSLRFLFLCCVSLACESRLAYTSNRQSDGGAQAVRGAPYLHSPLQLLLLLLTGWQRPPSILRARSHQAGSSCLLEGRVIHQPGTQVVKTSAQRDHPHQCTPGSVVFLHLVCPWHMLVQFQELVVDELVVHNRGLTLLWSHWL